jgi:xanthine dehydrogenase accessory factor
VNLYAEILRLQGEGRSSALCTIVRTTGSTPGKDMMKMLVREDGTFAGTVGGGCLEAEVLEAALESIRDERSRWLEFRLNERDYPDSGLLCGGKVEIYVEPITEPKVHIFGGGHVSGAITKVARLAGFHVTVGDDREPFTTAAKHPEANERICAPFVDQVAGLRGAEGLYVVVVTRGHEQDGDILQALFEAGCAPRFLGMIGSRAKRATLFARLSANGVSQEFLDSVQSPMGVPIGARTHEEIAVSVVAEMIRVRRQGSSAS